MQIDVVEMEKPKTENLENPCFPYIYRVERVAIMLVNSVSNFVVCSNTNFIVIPSAGLVKTLVRTGMTSCGFWIPTLMRE